jgi:hypothetical protein
MADEAYAQRNSTGTSGIGGDALNVYPLLNALLSRIDAAKNERDKKERCDELFRHLSSCDAAAYEWQGYYSRCKPMDYY